MSLRQNGGSVSAGGKVDFMALREGSWSLFDGGLSGQATAPFRAMR